MSKYIDLNCDMGESYYDKIVGNDSKIMPYITSCNIACGFHGGDPLTIGKTIKLAIDNKVKIGAHPSYFDLEGFGRRKIHLNLKELESIILYQVSAIKGITEYYGEKLHHVKPHGALYNMASIDDNIAEVIVLTIKRINPKLKLYGPSKMKWKKISQKHGIKYVSEVFSDRNYNDNLTLVNRNNENSMITDINDSIIHLSRMINKGKVKTVNNKLIDIDAETICIHGDQPNAQIFAKRIYNTFKSKISE